jgi:aspartyl aminopeptidase
LGKIDMGGGGTVAKYLANYGMDIIDCGTPLLAMHSPYEISSKLDVYETYRAFSCFFKA